jgi:hypothetical protein
MAVVNCDAIPGSFARVVGKLGNSLTNRAHRENFHVLSKNDVLSK